MKNCNCGAELVFHGVETTILDERISAGAKQFKNWMFSCKIGCSMHVVACQGTSESLNLKFEF